MQDNDFEKQVLQKMAELKLLPSEAVWRQVEMRLHPKEKRRGWIIWLPLFLIALSLGGYIVFNSGLSFHGKNINADSKISIQHPANEKDLLMITKEKSVSSDNKIYEDKRLDDDSKTIRVPSVPEEKLLVSGNTSHEKSKPVIQQNSQTRINTSVAKLFSKTARPESDRKSPGTKSGNTKPVSGNLYASTDLLQEDTHSQHSQNVEMNAKSELTTTDQNLHQEAEFDVSPAAVKTIVISTMPANINLLPITVNPRMSIQTKPQARDNGWEWGLSFQGGRSSLTNGASFNQIFSGALNYSASSNLSANSNPVYKELYPLHASAGFSAGAFFKRHLIGRFSFSVGLNYRLFTTSNTVGARVDSVIMLPSTLVSNQQAFNQYYRSGNTVSYTNKYHFIELPLVFQAKLTRKWKLPINWELGFSVSRLVAANALHFDSNKGVYYKDNDLINNTQFNFITGLPVKLSSGKKFVLQAGPELQYGISRVDTKENTAGKHFLFLGLKATLVLGKK